MPILIILKLFLIENMFVYIKISTFHLLFIFQKVTILTTKFYFIFYDEIEKRTNYLKLKIF